MLLCLTYSDADTGVCADAEDLAKYQMINRIPGLKNILFRKDAFCNTMNDARKIPAVMRAALVPLCFVLPEQYQQFLNVADALGYSAQWLLTPLALGGREAPGGPQLVDLFTALGRATIHQSSTKRSVVQQVPKNPLLVFGQPVSVRLFVLITSVFPLRAYLHNEGMVRVRSFHPSNANKATMKVQPLSRFWRFVERNYGSPTLKLALESLEDVLVRTLIVAEALLYSAQQGFTYRHARCSKCFQLLGFDVTFNMSFHPTVSEVNGQPSFYVSSRKEDEPTNRLKKQVLEDTVAILFSKESVADDVAEAIGEVFDNLGIMGLSCQISHDLCLSREDLVHLLNNRREAKQMGGYRKLYPSFKSGQYRSFIEDLDHMVMSKADVNVATDGMFRTPSQHRTADMHPVLVAFERYFSRRLVGDDSYSDVDFDINQVWKIHNTSHTRDQPEEDFFSEQPDKYSWSQVASKAAKDADSAGCSIDPGSLALLAQIITEPSLQLEPTFTAQRTEYTATVSYDTLLLRVWGVPQHCHARVHVDDKFAPSRPTNYSLGIGDNKVVLYVMDSSQSSDPWVVNTYTISVRRLSITDGEESFTPATPHQVCSLKQECEMPVANGGPCGLYNEISSDWPTYLEKIGSLPLCSDGSSQGRWILPCHKCSHRDTCYWKEARWQPYQCRYAFLPQRTLARCMADKKLLFIGDSTNRGMMHYAMERLNGTLQQWDKTHDLRLYSNLNRGETSVSFAYYPQFWLPTQERPVFDKALYQLIERSKPLQNNSNTILVVGGVHWLATQHLYMLVKALRRDHLHGIKVIIKTLGAGFHQPVDGVHCLSTNDQKKLMLQNQWLIEFAKHYAFEVIDTFNMTVARYKDFLQGKCACHFHRVVPLSTFQENGYSRQTQPPSFHVEGGINAMYSEILLNRICAHEAEVSR
ncbi:cadherin-like and PC-esterase domain-containing protein 1 [Ornithodoros turicata]